MTRKANRIIRNSVTLEGTRDNSPERKKLQIPGSQNVFLNKHLMAFHVNPGVDLLCDALENRYDRITEESDKDVTFQNDHRHYAGI